MPTFILPDPGEGLLEAEIVTWHVAVGDEVEVNDIVCDVETHKSIVELPSPWAGRVTEILVEAGRTVAVGTPLITISEAASAGNASPAEARPAEAVAAESAPAETPAPAVLVGYGAAETGRRSRRVPAPAAAPVPAAPPAPAPAATAPAPAAPMPSIERALAKPQTRRLARDLGVDLDTLTGTGPDGVVTSKDVLHAAMGDVVTPSSDERVPLMGVQREMSKAMTASNEVPQATVWLTADVTETMNLLATLKARKDYANVRLSPLLVCARATCLALSDNIGLNSTLDDQAAEIVRHRDVNLGIAVDTPKGLVVPNVKAANRLSLPALAEQINEVVQRTRVGKAKPSDLQGGTFTITNVGVFQVEGGTPILPPGESAILCLGAIVRRPWVMGSGETERIEPRWVCTLSLTFDHRFLDGAMASHFLREVSGLMGNPGLALVY